MRPPLTRSNLLTLRVPLYYSKKHPAFKLDHSQYATLFFYTESLQSRIKTGRGVQYESLLLVYKDITLL